MPVKIYNTASKMVEHVVPRKHGELSVYACGPTVYSYAHIGNFRSFIAADLLVRTAKRAGYKVSYVSNITDVGHLTVDDLADAAGVDKLASAFEGQKNFQNIYDLARHYTSALTEDWQRLRLLEPMVRPRASEHVAEQIESIQRLLFDGYAYETSKGVYFEVSKFERYGALSGNDGDDLLGGSRDLVQDPEKKSARDFALWKKDNKHLMRWQSPFGWGYPGWHIECSAMAMKYLGEQIDIHTGGEDNKFPHHECEIAQSEALTGKTFAAYWLHTAHLLVDGKRMSKRSGNFFTVRDIIDKGVQPMALRLALIASRYRDQLNFTWGSLEAFGKVEVRLREARDKVLLHTNGNAAENLSDLQALNDTIVEIDNSMRNDLNTPEALAALNSGLRYINSNLDKMSDNELLASANWFDQVDDALGIIDTSDFRPVSMSGDQSSNEIIETFIQVRCSAKEKGNYELADAIRSALIAAGIELIDTTVGTEWKVKRQFKK